MLCAVSMMRTLTCYHTPAHLHKVPCVLCCVKRSSSCNNLPDPRTCLGGEPGVLSTFWSLQGRIFTDGACPELSEQERGAVYTAMAATLAALHSVDPAAVGLQRFGRPSGYCKRQARSILRSLDKEQGTHVTWP